jgi:hypothetical protein
VFLAIFCRIKSGWASSTLQAKSLYKSCGETFLILYGAEFETWTDLDRLIVLKTARPNLLLATFEGNFFSVFMVV